MKLVKKLIAIASALAMTATMATSLVVHADDVPPPAYPILTPTLVETSTEGVYDLKINLNNTYLTSGKKVYTFNFYLTFDTTKLDTANSVAHMVWDDDEEMDVPSWQYVTVDSSYATAAKKWNNGNTFAFVFADMSGAGISNSSEIGTDIVTIKNLKLLDGVTTDDITLTPYGVHADCGKSSGKVAYDQDLYGNVVVNSAIFPGNKPAEPVEPAKPTVKDDGTILPITPSDIGGSGDVFVGEDGSKAVAGLGNFTPTGTVNGIEWTIKYTPKGEAEVTKSKTFTPDWLAGANLETKMTIGLIVNYNPAEYDNVTIVSGSLN